MSLEGLVWHYLTVNLLRNNLECPCIVVIAVLIYVKFPSGKHTRLKLHGHHLTCNLTVVVIESKRNRRIPEVVEVLIGIYSDPL